MMSAASGLGLSLALLASFFRAPFSFLLTMRPEFQASPRKGCKFPGLENSMTSQPRIRENGNGIESSCGRGLQTAVQQ